MGVEALLLGVAQDAGVPQLGCSCANCNRVKDGSMGPQHAVSLALIDHEANCFFLVDATPDIRHQLGVVWAAVPGFTFAGVLLTHMHVGHYCGLIHLGREAMNVQQLPVYASSRACAFLRSNGPWSQLVSLGNVELHELAPGAPPLRLTPGLSVEPALVPHRSEFSDTLAFTLRGPAGRSLFYCPDIDSWAQWEAWPAPAGRSLADVVASVDVCLLDATFFSGEELPGRDIVEVPHPFITDTLARLPPSEDVGQGREVHEVVLVHLNHTNPAWQEGSEARAACAAAGARVGREGWAWQL